MGNAEQRVWNLMTDLGITYQCSKCQKPIKQGQPYKVSDSLLYCGECADSPCPSIQHS